MAWNRPSNKAMAMPKQKRNGFRFPVLGAAVLIALSVISWLLWPDSSPCPKSSDQRRNSRIKEVKPSLSRKPVVTEEERPASKEKPKVSEKTIEKISRIEAIVRKRMANTNGTVVLDKPLLKEPTDQLYYEVFCRELGDMPPLTPHLQEKEEIKAVLAVNTKLLPEKDDTEDQLAAKEIVNEVKDALGQFMSEGGTINEFFDYYCDKLEAAYELRHQAIISLNDVAKNETTKTGRDYIEKVNAKLAENGIKPIQFSNVQMMMLEYNETKGSGHD